MKKLYWLFICIGCCLSCQEHEQNTEVKNEPLALIITDEVYQLLNDAYLPVCKEVLRNKDEKIILMESPVDRSISRMSKDFASAIDHDFFRRQINTKGKCDTCTIFVNIDTSYEGDIKWDSSRLPDAHFTTLEHLRRFFYLNQSDQSKQFRKEWKEEYGYGFVSITIPVFSRDSTTAYLEEDVTNFDWFCGSGKCRLLKFVKEDGKWNCAQKKYL
ncbi:hypothetical protein [Persicobacter diffluens]|uniref:Uncharacterized protein n=1 Tax=Persicobacter diffluens TaxID=981 RepID=A0AAN4W079_9BACT|nr:hypothetical protein PEDI_32740 [Persicobacter diffluens]